MKLSFKSYIKHESPHLCGLFLYLFDFKTHKLFQHFFNQLQLLFRKRNVFQGFHIVVNLFY